MNISEENVKRIKVYLNEFKVIAPEWFKKNDFVSKYYYFFQDFIKKENLEKADWNFFQKLGENIHSFQVMALAKTKALGRPNHDIQHYRDSFLYLVYSSDPIDIRIRNFVENDKYKIRNFGISVISEIIGNIFAKEFVFFNRRDEFAVKLLNVNTDIVKTDNYTDRFIKYNIAIKPIIALYEEIVGRSTDLPVNIEVDQFFSYLYETNKGKIEPPKKEEEKKYWIYQPGENARMWKDCLEKGICCIDWFDMGNLSDYNTLDEIKSKMKEIYGEDSSYVNNGLACYEFVNIMTVGDIVYVKKGRNSILGYGEIASDYYYDESREEYRNCRKVKWIKTGEWITTDKMGVKTLTNVTIYSDFVENLKNLVLTISKTSNSNTKNSTSNYWWLNANPKRWDFRKMKVGDVNDYDAYTENGHKARIFKHFQNLKINDIILGYITYPDYIIDSICEVTNIFRENGEVVRFEFKKTEQFKNPVTLNELKSIPELENCEPIINNQGSLFKVTDEEYENIRSLIDEKKPLEIEIKPIVIYTPKQALAELFIEESQYNEICYILKYKKNIILQGPPGVGKTFIAKRIAYSIMGVKDTNRVQMIQFHQSYSYEDFIQGYRPTESGGFERKDGVFYEFCKKAQRDPDNSYFFVIDEINRGNLSKIFGELMMLIEKDKRGTDFAIPLTYSKNEDETFYIPSNLHFIGTMNTADRSLAMVDYALRRRFGFVSLQPAFELGKYREFLLNKNMAPELTDKVIRNMKKLNENISSDNKNLGEGYQIGHSYFCPDGVGTDIDENWYIGVINNEIKPLLNEYWFDNPDKVKDEINRLLGL